MIARVISGALLGIDGHRVDVEVDLAIGVPAFTTVGLPEGAVRESKDRVKAAIKNSGYPFPRHRVTVNLAPADLKKEGGGYDLPVAVGILAAMGLLESDDLDRYALVGELSLDGRVKPIRGILPMAVMVRDRGLKGILVPPENAAEAAVVEGIDVLPVRSLSQAVRFLTGEIAVEPERADLAALFSTPPVYEVDFADVKGQEHVKRALEVAAAGGHNVLMIGPPGSGKTMLARRLPTVLPALSFEEALEVTKIHSVAGRLDTRRGLLVERPFRATHTTISDAGLIGGGRIPAPGELSLAHNGVLFLDELPEFRRNVLEMLRAPMEDGAILISRASGSLSFPARAMVVAAMNPCPCGYFGDTQRACSCAPPQIQRYRGRVSGPLLDRMDVHVEVPAVNYRELTEARAGEPSAAIRERVNRAREIQSRRFATTPVHSNAQMSARLIGRHCRLDDGSARLLERAIERLALSARAYARILKVARTIADLDASEDIRTHHLSEAIQYRTLDREAA